MLPSVVEWTLPTPMVMTSSIRRSRRGFTILELLIVVVMMAALAAVSMGRTSKMMTGWRVTRAAQALSEELQTSFSLVGRNRKPLTITFDTTTMELRMTDRTGVVYRRRQFGKDSEYRLTSRNIMASRLTLEVYPPGLAADSLSVSISSNGKGKRVRMLRGGLTQVCNSEASVRCD